MTGLPVAGFGAQLLTLPQIFESRVFTVPDFQRSYAWDDRQVEELLKDVDHLIGGGAAHRHYTGTLVLSRAEGPDDGHFRIVDGQQRLTTLVIALRLLRDQLPAQDQPGFTALYLRRGVPGSDRAVLQLNSDTRQFFEKVVLGDGRLSNELVALEAHARLLKARRVIQTWLRACTTAGVSTSQLRDAFERELGFLVYAPTEDAETGIMFEVINNRGKPLSELEKVKNYLIYCCVKLGATTLRADIDLDWSQILRHLNIAKKTQPADEGAFIRYCMVVYFKLNKAESQYGYDELKKRLVLDEAIKDASLKLAMLEDMAAFVQFMKSAALWFARLYGQAHKGLNTEMVAVLDQIRAQDRHASIMPLFLALVIKPDLCGDVLLRLLQLLERLNFRVYLARNMVQRNDSGQGALYGYAAAFFHGELLTGVTEEEHGWIKAEIKDELLALEFRLVQFALWCALDDRFVGALQLEPGSTDDFFKWGGLRYFLMSYEQHLQPNKTIQIDKITLSRSEGKSADYLSVEHRWALGNRNAEGENNRAIDRFEKRRLGNFVLLELRLNIQGSDGRIEDKQIKYVDGNGEEPGTDLQQVKKMFKDAKQVLKELEDKTRSKNYYLDLNRLINDRVEERLRKFALSRWSLKEYLGFKELKAKAVSGYADDDA